MRLGNKITVWSIWHIFNRQHPTLKNDNIRLDTLKHLYWLNSGGSNKKNRLAQINRFSKFDDLPGDILIGKNGIFFSNFIWYYSLNCHSLYRSFDWSKKVCLQMKLEWVLFYSVLFYILFSNVCIRLEMNCSSWTSNVADSFQNQLK